MKYKQTAMGGASTELWHGCSWKQSKWSRSSPLTTKNADWREADKKPEYPKSDD